MQPAPVGSFTLPQTPQVHGPGEAAPCPSAPDVWSLALAPGMVTSFLGSPSAPAVAPLGCAQPLGVICGTGRLLAGALHRCDL